MHSILFVEDFPSIINEEEFFNERNILWCNGQTRPLLLVSDPGYELVSELCHSRAHFLHRIA